jgi:hypothetical protein
VLLYFLNTRLHFWFFLLFAAGQKGKGDHKTKAKEKEIKKKTM